MIIIFNINKVLNSDNQILIKTEFGGHIGWYEGLFPTRWFILKCLNFCESLINIKISKDIQEYKNNSQLNLINIEKNFIKTKNSIKNSCKSLNY